MGSQKKLVTSIPVPYQDVAIKEALSHGDLITRASALIMGLGNLIRGQYIKGLLFLFMEVSYIVYMITFGFSSLRDFMTLGTKVQEEVFNETKQIYEYVVGDNSMLCLLYGVITIAITILFIMMMVASIKSAYQGQRMKEHGIHPTTFKEDLASLKHQNLHKTLLFLPLAGIITFTVIPLVYMILIAFTSYDKNHQPPGNLFDWVGFDNFIAMFDSSGILAQTFWPILGWTIIWAIVATFSCYILGLLLAILINRDGTRFKSFWRFTFVLSIAVPQFVTLLTMRTVFNTNGPVNAMLREFGVIGATASIPFLTDPTLAKITIICVNIWIGVPFTMLNATGILKNIPRELYEAAKVDGANAVVTFFKITLPYILFVMTPMLITAFVGNINNFNIIYLLTGGGPESIDYYNAGKTDLLVTWLYKLTITNKDYNIGAVIGIVVFIILATLSLLTYRHTGSYKEEEGFQ